MARYYTIAHLDYSQIAQIQHNFLIDFIYST